MKTRVTDPARSPGQRELSKREAAIIADALSDRYDVHGLRCEMIARRTDARQRRAHHVTDASSVTSHLRIDEDRPL